MTSTRFALALILAFLATPSTADAQRWTLRLQGLASDAPRGFSFRVFDTAVDVDYTPGVGIGASIEYALSRRIGLDLSVFYIEHDVDVAAVGPTRALAVGVGLDLIPSTFAVTVHLTPRQKFDLYLLAGVGTVLSSTGPGTSSNSVVAGIGLDVTLGDNGWALAASLRHLAGSAPRDFDFGPLLSFGVARKL